MKIYILRHEERPSDCSFFTPLTYNGLLNARKIADIIKNEDLKIDFILCSPFIRTLQTISPYVIKNNLLINLEYGLSEIHIPECINLRAVGLELPKYIAKSFNYNKSYDSIIKYNEIKYPEKIIDVNIRVNKILKHLLNNYTDKNINILIVTHQSLCACVLKNIINSSHVNCEIKKKIENSNLINNYKTGKICLIFNEKQWDFKEIN